MVRVSNFEAAIISDKSTCTFQAHPTEGLRFAVEPPFMRRSVVTADRQINEGI